MDPKGRSLALSVTRRAGPGWLTLGGTLARETTDQKTLDWGSRGLSLEYAAEVGNWSGSARLGAGSPRFDDEDGTFLVRRRDETGNAGLTLSHREVSWRGYQPVLTVDWSRTDSNIALYDRKVASVRVGLNRLF